MMASRLWPRPWPATGWLVVTVMSFLALFVASTTTQSREAGETVRTGSTGHAGWNREWESSWHAGRHREWKTSWKAARQA
jgi:hypothetical protein